MGIIIPLLEQASVFITVSQFHPCVILVSKARGIPIEGSLYFIFLAYFILSRLFSLACQYYTRVEVTGNDKHASLLQ